MYEVLLHSPQGNCPAYGRVLQLWRNRQFHKPVQEATDADMKMTTESAKAIEVANPGPAPADKVGPAAETKGHCWDSRSNSHSECHSHPYRSTGSRKILTPYNRHYNEDSMKPMHTEKGYTSTQLRHYTCLKKTPAMYSITPNTDNENTETIYIGDTNTDSESSFLTLVTQIMTQMPHVPHQQTTRMTMPVLHDH